jgi:tRNA 2-thiouridine synthesizing protein A
MTNGTSTDQGTPRTGETFAADATLDCKGLLCPLPVYKASQAMRKLSAGQVLKVVCTDPGSLPDFSAFARQQGHTLLSAEEREGVQLFHLRKEQVR